MKRFHSKLRAALAFLHKKGFTKHNGYDKIKSLNYDTKGVIIMNIRKIIAAAVSAIMLAGNSAQFAAFADGSVRFEAENGTLGGAAYIEKDDSASGSKAVTFTDATCTWTQKVNMTEEGFYDIRIYSKGQGGDKFNDLLINGESAGTFKSAEGEGYSEYTVARLYFNKGANTIKMTMSWGYFMLDYIELEKSAIPENIYAVSKQLSNSNASDKTKRLFSYMADVYGKKVITGQYCDGGLNGSEFKGIKNATGKTPAMLGLDMMRYTPARVKHGDSSKAVENAIEFSKAGGIVTFCWHWNLPDKFLKSGTDSSGNPRWWGGFYTDNADLNKFDLSAVMDGSDPETYNALMSDVDAIAKQLTRLKEADVPVLFRPLHEASGGWFWWGSDGAEAYKKLWKAVYEKLTNEYQLDNLIWVYNGQAAEWYPGDEYVDIIGEDIYPGTRQYSPQSSKFIEAAEYSNSRKIVALSENGCLFDLDKAFEAGTAWSYFGTWSGEFCISSSEKYTEKTMWKKVYQSDCAINLDDLPDFSIYPLDSGSSSATVTLSETAKTLAPGDVFQLRATVTPAGDNVTWKSTNTAVATVSGGKVTAMGAGTAEITASLPNGSKAVCKVTVERTKLTAANVSNIASRTYTGKEIKPAVTVKYGGKTLVSGKDYTVSYSNNVKVGTAKATVTGIGNYSGSVEKTFIISPMKQTITAAESACKGIKLNWPEDEAATGYEVQYSPNSGFAGSMSKKVSGTASTTITGLTGGKTYYVKVRSLAEVGGKTYAGAWSNVVSVKAAKYDITKAKVSGIADKVYNGKNQTQKIKVTYNGKTLKSGTDYTLKYASRKNVGTATVKIVGAGDYAGTIKKTFKINPEKQKIEKLIAKSKGFTVKWAKTAYAAGFEIQYAENAKFRRAKKVTVSDGTSVKKSVTKLRSAKKYYVRVRTYTTVSGKKYYGAWSAAKSVTTKK